MLWDASALDGYAIEASDGRIGSVSDFLFEDTSWKVRWLVVDTGGWLSGRKVLLPLSALEKPDPSLRQFPVKLTMQQVKDSPDIDTDRPVSRQHENLYLRPLRVEPILGQRPPADRRRDRAAVHRGASSIGISAARHDRRQMLNKAIRISAASKP